MSTECLTLDGAHHELTDETIAEIREIMLSFDGFRLDANIPPAT